MSHRRIAGRRARTARLGAVLVAGALALGACTAQGVGSGSASSASGAAASSGSGSVAVLDLPSPSATYDPSADPVVRLVKRVAPSVVLLTVRTSTSLGPFGQPVSGKAVGTGFVVRSDGVVLTNEHVVAGGSDITATLADGRTVAARVLKTDPEHDLAVLKIDATGLPAVTLGDSSTLAVGTSVVAIGYALDLAGGPTVTAGIISSLARTIQVQDDTGTARTYRDVLQTDAALNPGNSGGPLLTLDGRVVGIDAAGGSQAENIGFAVAVNAARTLLQSAAPV